MEQCAGAKHIHKQALGSYWQNLPAVMLLNIRFIHRAALHCGWSLVYCQKAMTIILCLAVI